MGQEGYDLDFRPESYWDDDDPIVEILSKIKGEQRKRRFKQVLAGGNVGAFQDWMIKESLSDEERAMFGQLHPILMGGEYLPDHANEEVEIARVALESTTGDVISVRARRRRGKVFYRVIDEYNTRFVCKPKHSGRPLSMGELIELIDTTHDVDNNEKGLTTSYRQSNLDALEEVTPEDLKGMLGFITVTSDFYPELEEYYQSEEREWLEEEMEKIGADFMDEWED